MEPAAVSAVIRLSPTAFARFCQEQAHALLQDVSYLQALRQLAQFVEAKQAVLCKHLPDMARIRCRMLLSEWKHEQAQRVDEIANWHYDALNQLTLCYQPDTQQLIYFYQLGERNPDEMQETPSVAVLLAQLAKYKDLPSPDYVLFFSSGTVLTDPLWRAFRVDGGVCECVDVTSVPPVVVSEHIDFAHRHFFNVMEMLENTLDESVSESDFNQQLGLKLLMPDLQRYMPPVLDLTTSCPW